MIARFGGDVSVRDSARQYVASALLGTAFAMFDRGIKNKLLKEIGEDMTTNESALSVLIKEADWGTLKARMDAKNFQDTTVISELVEEPLDEVEKLVENDNALEAVPEEIELPMAQ